MLRNISLRTPLIKLTMLICISCITPLSIAAMPIAINGQELPSLAPILERTTSAVVNISVAGTKTVQAQANPLEFFFGQRRGQAPQSSERAFQGLGSGVIINAQEGYIVTNNHVIDDADKINITLTDGRKFKAKLVGRDKNSDIALLQIKADKLTELKLANSDELRVGDFAIAIGNPFGLGQTVTSGIISALARSGLNIEALENFIQTDAAINQGNSGGALINLRGELIGINTAIIAPGGGNIGIGFAIPANMVKNLTKQIEEFGEVRRGLLGIVGQELTVDLANAFGIKVNKGAFISQVQSGSAAAEAGILPGDVITEVDGKQVNSFAELRAKIATAGVGKKMLLTITREGKQQQVAVTLKQATAEISNPKVMHQALDGAQLKNSSKKDGILGVKISSLQEGSPAAKAGLQKGDIILRVNRVRVENIKQLDKALKEVKDTVLAFNIKRGTSSLYLIVN